MHVASTQQLTRLLRFYAACVEAEDRRSLTRRLSDRGRSLASPWDDAEPFFWPEAASAEAATSRKGEGELLAGEPGPARLVYGYPVWLDAEGSLTPLFLCDVEAEEVGRGRYRVARLQPDQVVLNHHLFRERGVGPEELRLLQEELEGEFGSFGDRLRAAFAALGEDLPPGLRRDALDPYPDDDTPRERWVNRPVLFASERSAFTFHLLRELELLERLTTLQAAFGVTAAGAVVRIDDRGTDPGRRNPGERRGDAAWDGPTAEPVPLLPVVPLDRSQRAAVEEALRRRLTVITGPPGTGKSQVVVTLLASFAAAGRPVLFASKNNKAVDVVRERLRAILGEEHDWVLRFGSREKVQEALEEVGGRLERLQGAPVPERPSPREVHRVDEELREAEAALDALQAAQAALARAAARAAEAAAALPAEVVTSWPDERGGPAGAGEAAAFVARSGALADWAARLAGRQPAGLWLRLQRLLWPGRLRRRLAAGLAELAAELPEPVRGLLLPDGLAGLGFAGLADAADGLTAVGRWREAVAAQEAARERLVAMPPTAELVERLQELQRRRAELAAAELRAVWTARLARRPLAARRRLQDYLEGLRRGYRLTGREWGEHADSMRAAFAALGREFPVWVVTNLSVRNVLLLDPGVFDLVIIDEASQCDVPSGLPLAFRADRLVVIGDPHQLRHVSTLRESEEERLAREHGVQRLLTAASYCRRSFYDVAEGALVEEGGEPLLLAGHYRSHPAIVEFSNQRFYQGRLVLRTHPAVFARKLGGEPVGVFWHDVRGRAARTMRSALNPDEVKAVVALLDRWAETGFLLRDDIDFGVVTPFRLQMEELAAALRRRPWYEAVRRRLTVGTAHRFQGDERDVVVFSPVVTSGLPAHRVKWAAGTEELLNVAVTRARAALHVVGDLAACQRAGGCLGEFARTVVALAEERPGPDGAVLHTDAVHDAEPVYESPAEAEVARLLGELGLWFRPQYQVGRRRIDFLVVTPYGRRYAVEVDGRQHRTSAAVRADAARDEHLRRKGFEVLRLPARDVFARGEAVRAVLARLV